VAAGARCRPARDRAPGAGRVGIAQHRHRRRIGRAVRIGEPATVGRQRDTVVGHLRREQRQSAAVEVHAIQVLVIRVARCVLAVGREPDTARLLVDAHDPRHVAGARGDAILELPGGEVVQIQMRPVVAIAPPDELVGGRQHAPQIFGVRGVTDLRTALLVEHRAHRARGRIGDTQPHLLVVTRAREERHLGVVIVPLQVAHGVPHAM
jgi:hypothetical protein